MKVFTIGTVARQAGIGVETVRFYEREGLLHKPERGLAGYRYYDADAVDTLRFIKQVQRHGFTLREIRELLALRLDPEAKRSEVRNRAISKVEDIGSRIAELQSMKKALQILVKACDGDGSVEGCPIITAFGCHVGR